MVHHHHGGQSPLESGRRARELLLTDLPRRFLSRRIEIPEGWRERGLAEFRLSVHLAKAMKRKNVWVLGDLHGKSFQELSTFRNCGPKALREISKLVALLQKRSPEGSIPKRSAANGSSVDEPFAVLPSVRELQVEDLPVSKRLGCAFKAMKIAQLGDLDGRGVAEFLSYKNCGRGSVAELRKLLSRAAKGDFNVLTYDKSRVAFELLRLVESALFKLPIEVQDLLLDRIGGRGKPPQTLELLGRSRGLTRERIRQMLNTAARKLRFMWGARIPRLLEQLKEMCPRGISQLSSESLARRLGHEAVKLKLSGEVHLRILQFMDKNCPPGGRK